jgi:hypothetical protein
VRACVFVALLGLPVAAAAQESSAPAPPAAPRLTVGGELSATLAPDDPGFFNYTDYEYNALRNIRIALAASVRASDHMELLGEVRLDHADTLRPYTAFVRIRPWLTRAFDIQIGRVPQTFGAFSATAYGPAHLLIGTPLAYQYLTSLRPDAVPASADDLLRMRGRGWLTSFPLGDPAPAPGVAMVNLTRRDTGLQVHARPGRWQFTAAVTAGTLSNPRLDDDNDGRQIAGRAVWEVTPGLRAGFSAARGAFLARELAPVTDPGRAVESYRQEAVAADVEFSRDRWFTRGEVIHSRWRLPSPATPALPPWVSATAWWVEGRYRVAPGVDVAARGERLGFSRVTGSNRTDQWDAPVRRLELGVSYRVRHNVALKGALQRNRRDGGRIRRDTLATAQVLYWF